MNNKRKERNQSIKHCLTFILAFMVIVAFSMTLATSEYQYGISINGQIKDGFYVVITEVRASYSGGNFYIYDNNGVVATCTSDNVDSNYYPSIDKTNKIVHICNVTLPGEEGAGDSTSNTTETPTNPSDKSETGTTEAAPQDVKIRVSFEATKKTNYYAWYSELTTARNTNGNLTVYNEDGSVHDTYPIKDFEYSSDIKKLGISKMATIYDFVPKSFPITNELYDHNKDYSNLKEGDVFSLRRNYDGTLTVFLVKKDIPPAYTSAAGEPRYAKLRDGNYVSYIQPSDIYHIVNGIKFYDNLSKECDVSFAWGPKLKVVGDEVVRDEVKKITKGCTTNREKAYKIAVWICENFYYDAKTATTSPVNLYNNRKARCAGYSSMFEYMCGYAGIPCITLTSWKINHAWNAIYLEGYWQPVDVTNMDYSANKKYLNYMLEFTAYGSIPHWQEDVTHNYAEFERFTKGTEITLQGVTYKVTSCTKNNYTVSVVEAKAKKGNKVVIPADITYGQKRLKVTKIDCNLTDGKYKLKSVTIGENVKSINGVIANSNTTKITFKTKKITSWSKVKLNCKNKKSVKITVPKSAYSKYKKAIKKKKSKVTISKGK